MGIPSLQGPSQAVLYLKRPLLPGPRGRESEQSTEGITCALDSRELRRALTEVMPERYRARSDRDHVAVEVLDDQPSPEHACWAQQLAALGPAEFPRRGKDLRRGCDTVLISVGEYGDLTW